VAAPARVAVAALASSALAGCGSSSHGGSHESLASEVDAQMAKAMKAEKLPPSAIPGGRLFARAGCNECHTYAGTGTRNLGASDLTRAGRLGRPRRFFAAYVADPRRFGNRIMPVYGDTFSARQIGELATFLAASKGVAH
jgi:mono/diheme cytochrome c family protein